eukprot:CAMPEP_0176425466 /NCGR_PEP_ID=MMETSP0127-20121128/11403_1 /TAXON_ID=938130 /ORGANISM="Platyophrya macrostoma, Strain WH" /LENGTH=444 /DNA_ID=CAMNT_0017806627 /DNA_START=17 /DNA_END=1351 /DNA_ORIENTATION=+
MKSYQSYVEIKTVTWAKDSHGLFDYESKNVTFNKNKIESNSKVYKEGSEIIIKSSKDADFLASKSKELKDSAQLFSIVAENEKNENFFLKVEDNLTHEYNKNTSLFLIVRSLKNDDGTQKGYNLELGDIIRLGRIEYRVIEFQDHNLKKSSMFNNNKSRPGVKVTPFNLIRKSVGFEKSDVKKQCRICLMDETEVDEFLVNPCNCKGTSEHVHVKCLQDWISSKIKKKEHPGVTCTYWKKLICEVCKISLPDVVDFDGESEATEIIPIQRPENPYILLERVFYDKSKENAENAKTVVLLNLVDQTHSIKLGRGHECDLRENDISVSRLHAFIKYVNGNFVMIDNNSKFGTLVLLRNPHKVERKKIALQIGRTVLTFSLKQSSINNIPVFKSPNLMDKFAKALPKSIPGTKPTTTTTSTKPKSTLLQDVDNQPQNQDLNGSFLDD